MKTPFESAYSALSQDIQAAMGSALVAVIQNTRQLAQERMIAAYDEQAAKEMFPHENMTAEERKACALQWADDAACKALKAFELSFIQSSIIQAAIA